MSAAKILIVILSQQGYWFGGDTGTIEVQWPTGSSPTDSMLVWQLMLGEVRTAEGRLALDGEAKAGKLSLAVPEVRVRTKFRWVYSLRAREGDAEQARGEATLEVFPRDVLARLGRRLEGKRPAVWDGAGRLSGLLSEQKIEHRTVRRASELQLVKADIILVAPDQLDSSPFAQGSLLGHAESGAGVFFFVQPRAKYLAEYPLVPRTVPPELKWREDHPLLNRLQGEDWASLLKGAKELRAVQLPADEAALELTWWPPETQSEEPVPIDAMLVTKAVGSGRIVLCQLPLGDWKTDPRSQMLLAGALDYLCTRPERTPPPSRRRKDQPPVATSLPTITIPPGGSQ